MATKRKTSKKRQSNVSGSSKRSRKKRSSTFTSFCFKWLFIALLWIGIAATLLVMYYAYDLPDIDKLYSQTTTPRITLLDSDGKEFSHFGNFYGDHVEYKDLPKNFINAILSTEDRRFFDHFGIDLFGLSRAMVVNMRAGRVVQGGSTITQQVAKVIFLTQDRTLKRKIQEMIIAFYLESHYTKEEIFTIYVNRIYFGGGNYGVAAAARSYFDKDVQNLNLYESALLAGLIKAPSRYSPTNDPKLAMERTKQVLENMVNYGAITTEDVLKHKYDMSSNLHKVKSSQGSYFSDWVKEQMSDYVAVIDKDITVKTTLNSKLQNIAAAVLSSNLDAVGKEKNISQGAIVVMKPNGEVLAMVGGRDYDKSQFNRATQAFRQPGSAFKLFIYLTAFAQGFDPSTIMTDQPISYGRWSPKNWDGKYVGDVTLRDAFAHSINTVAIQLAEKVGIGEVIKTARKLGVTKEINYDLSSALGTSEIPLIDITAAYATMPNNGNLVWVKAIKKIEDKDNKVLFNDVSESPSQVISRTQLLYMNDLLKSVVRYGTGTRAAQGFDVAGKTGTSQDSRDAWFIGFSSEYVVGVWVGNDNNSPMKKVGGGSVPAAIFGDFMRQAMYGVPAGSIESSYSAEVSGEGDNVEQKDKKWEKSIWDSIFGGSSNKNDDGVTIEYSYPKKKN